MKETMLGGHPAGRKKIAEIEVLTEPEIKENGIRRRRHRFGGIGPWIRQYIKDFKAGEEYK